MKREAEQEIYLDLIRRYENEGPRSFWLRRKQKVRPGSYVDSMCKLYARKLFLILETKAVERELDRRAKNNERLK